MENWVNNEDNGDMYYLLAMVFKYLGDTENYAEALSEALQCSYSLTYPKDSVQKEYNAVSEKFEREEEEDEEDEGDEDEEVYEEEDGSDDGDETEEYIEPEEDEENAE